MPPGQRTGRHFTEAARIAAAEAKRVKREAPDTFGLPELFVVKAGPHAFTWELRRFGGLVLQRGPDAFPDAAAARIDGEAALATLCASPDLPTFKRQERPGAPPEKAQAEAVTSPMSNGE